MGRPATKVDSWSDLFIEGGQGCWEWHRTDSHGYGYVSVKNKRRHTHILSFKLTHGRDPSGLVRHTCDNRACYRPDRLIEGSSADNSRDMVERDRHARGERNGNAKLTAVAVLDIRERRSRGESGKVLAAEYGVSSTLIYDVANGKGWRDERNFSGRSLV